MGTSGWIWEAFGNYEKYFFGDELHGDEEREGFKGKFDVSYLCN